MTLVLVCSAMACAKVEREYASEGASGSAGRDSGGRSGIGGDHGSSESATKTRGEMGGTSSRGGAEATGGTGFESRSSEAGATPVGGSDSTGGQASVGGASGATGGASSAGGSAASTGGTGATGGSSGVFSSAAVGGTTAIHTTAAIIPVYLFDGGGLQDKLGGRAGGDSLCRARRTSDFPSLPATVHAFISVTSSDEIRDMPSNYGVPTTVPVASSTGVVIANNWADLLDGSIDVSLASAGVLLGTVNGWYSGSSSAGALDAKNCTNWTSPGVSHVFDATFGVAGSTDSTWIGNPAGGALCGADSYHILCLAY